MLKIITIFLLVLAIPMKSMALTESDYIEKINLIKTGYLDDLWVAGEGQYKEGTYALTWLNCFMAQTIAILAGHGEASSMDISRANAVFDKLVVYPCYTGGTWTHLMNGTGDKHAAVEQPVAEALYFGWKYRTELGLSSDTITAIFNHLTVNHTITIDLYNSAGSTGHSLSIDYPMCNQSTSKWKFNRESYAVMAGGSEWQDELDTLIHSFLQYMEAENPETFTGTNLFSDFGWQYTDIWGNVFDSAEYGQMCLGGMLLYLPEISTYLNLTPTEIAKLKAWQRMMLGQWQMDGYLNWDTVWSSGRIHSLSYWMWSLRSLLGIARSSTLNMGGTDDQKIAKYLFDAAVTTFFTMDQLNGDAADYAVSSDYFSSWNTSSSTAYYNNAKSSSNAKMVMELAMAVEFGLGDDVATAPSNVWSWAWTKKHLHVSTPYYSAAILPYAPVITGGWDGADAVQMQNWGLSHMQVPTNLWLTGFGGYGTNAFSFTVTNNSSVDIATASTAPSTSNVYLDGVQQTRTNYDTTEYPLSFTNSLQMSNSGAGSNYRVNVDTYFYQDYITETYSSTLIGTPGTGQVVLSIPARKDVVIDYIPVDGSKTVIWDGETVTPAGSPENCKYIHLKWEQWNTGLIIIPTSVSCGDGAKVTALGSAPSGYPIRQPDQDRSLLIYLADNDSTMGDVSITYNLKITDGTDSGAQTVFGETTQIALRYPNGDFLRGMDNIRLRHYYAGSWN